MRPLGARPPAALLALAITSGGAAARGVPLELEAIGVAEEVSDDFNELNPYVPPVHVEVGDRLPIALRFDGDDLAPSECSTLPDESVCYRTSEWQLEIQFSNGSVVEDIGVLELQLFSDTPTFALSTLLSEPFVVELEDGSGAPVGPSTDPEALLLSPSVRATHWGFFPGGASVSGRVEAVPEPAAAALTLVGGALLTGWWRARARASSLRRCAPRM